MAYKKKEKISLMLYYDYLEQFECLTDEQLRQLIYAMIEFDKNEKEIQLDKVTKMAFIPIKKRLKLDKKKWVETCEINSENAKKRWNKNNATVCDGMPMDAKYADIEREIEKEIDIEKEIEGENNIYSSIPTPTLDEILNYSFELNVNDKEYCEKFYNHYEGIGWVNGAGQKIKNWKLVFKNWIKKDNLIKNEKQEYDTRKFYEDENGLFKYDSEGVKHYV